MVQRGKRTGTCRGPERALACLLMAGGAAPAFAQDAAPPPAQAASTAWAREGTPATPQVQEVVVTSERTQTVLARTPLHAARLEWPALPGVEARRLESPLPGDMARAVGLARAAQAPALR